MKPIHHFWFSMFACTVLLGLLVAIADAATPSAAYGRIPLRFETNQGQADPEARFVARQGQGSVLLTRAGLTIAHEASVVSLQTVGGLEVEPVGEKLLTGVSRYYGPGGEITAPHVAQVRYPQIYPGVDLLYYGDPQRLEHDFIVAPGADPSAIQWRIDGAEGISLAPNGDLVLQTADGDIRLLAPVAYQTAGSGRTLVDSRFELLAADTVSFRLGAYDAERELIIDPVLDYGTYLGGARAETHAAIQVNDRGEAYIVGATRSLDFPATLGAAQDAYAGGSCGSGSLLAAPCYDAFVAKLNADGSDLLWATYFGGTGNDLPADAALGLGDFLAVAGTTESTDFPTSAGALKTASTDSSGSRSDGFVIQLNRNGERVYATLLGGSGVDQLTGVAIESNGAATVTGHTKSTDYPITATAFQPSRAGDDDHTDVVFTRLSAAGDALLYSTYFGRPLDERGGDVVVVAPGRYAISGSTASLSFPLDDQGEQGAPTGRADAFLALFTENSYARGLLVGGSGNDTGGDLAADGLSSIGGLYMIGSTDSRDLPTTNGAALPLWKRSQGFLLHVTLTSDDLTRIFTNTLTYLVGAADSLSIDEDGAAWVSGVTSSSSSVFGGAVVEGCQGTLLRRYRQTRLSYSSFVPGLGAIAAGPGRTVFSVGTDASGSLRTTPGAFQSALGGRSDVYAAKWIIDEENDISITCVEHGASFTAGAVAPGQLVSLFGSGLGRLVPSGVRLDEGRVATEADGVQVLFNEKPAPLLFVGWNQINAVAPYSIAGSSEVEIVVVKDGARSEPFVLPVTDAHPGLLTRDSTGSGVAALLNADGTINTADNPAEAGSVVTLFGTGEGSPDRIVVDGEIISEIVANLPRPTLPVTVMIGDQSAEVLYAGAAPELVAGVLQINVRIPANTPPGLAPVQVTIGGKFNRQTAFVAVQ